MTCCVAIMFLISMVDFIDLFKEKLNEATWKNLRKMGINLVPNKRILYAIENRKQVDLDYVDGDGVKNHRNVEIYAYGISRAHNQIIRVFQTWGGSRTMHRNGKEWRTLRVDRIKRLRVLDTFSSFDNAPNKRFGGVPNYKMNDKDMIYIFKQVKFGPGPNKKADKKQIYTKPENIAASSQTTDNQELNIATQQQTQEPPKPQVDDKTMQDIATQAAAKIPAQGAVDPDTGKEFKQDFQDKVNIIKDKLTADAESSENDQENDEMAE